LVRGLSKNRVLPFTAGLFLLFMIGLMQPVSAGALPTVSLSASPSTVTVTAPGSASTTITVTVPSVDAPSLDAVTIRLVNLVLNCVGLPAGASCTTTPSPLPASIGNGYQFILTISATASTAPGTYSVTVALTGNLPFAIIQWSFLAISTAASGIGPSSISVQQGFTVTPSITITVIVIPPPPPPAVHPLNVGGEMVPVDMLRVVAPWIATMLALTVVAVEMLVIRRKNRKP